MQILFTINLITWENRLTKDSLRTWVLVSVWFICHQCWYNMLFCTSLFTPWIGPCFVFYILYRNILLQTYFIYLSYNTTAIILFLQNFILFLHFLLPFHFHYFMAVFYFLYFLFSEFCIPFSPSMLHTVPIQVINVLFSYRFSLTSSFCLHHL